MDDELERIREMKKYCINTFNSHGVGIDKRLQACDIYLRLLAAEQEIMKRKK
jgi:hypothetical protein